MTTTVSPFDLVTAGVYIAEQPPRIVACLFVSALCLDNFILSETAK